jgi:hypothetical protein
MGDLTDTPLIKPRMHGKVAMVLVAVVSVAAALILGF